MQWMVKLVHLLLCCGFFIIIIIHESVCLDLSQNLAMKKESHGKKKKCDWFYVCDCSLSLSSLFCSDFAKQKQKLANVNMSQYYASFPKQPFYLIALKN